MKKTVLILTILVTAIIAWVIAFPDNNPVTRLFATAKTKLSGSGSRVSTPGTVPAGETGLFNPPPPVVQDVNGFPLMQGSRGEYVKNLQRAMNQNFGSELDVDGIFGPITFRALSSHGFDADAVSYQEYLQILRG